MTLISVPKFIGDICQGQFTVDQACLYTFYPMLDNVLFKGLASVLFKEDTDILRRIMKFLGPMAGVELGWVMYISLNVYQDGFRCIFLCGFCMVFSQ